MIKIISFLIYNLKRKKMNPKKQKTKTLKNKFRY